MLKRFIIWLFFLIFSGCSFFGNADVLYLKNGETMEGDVEEKDGNYILHLPYGSLNFQRGEVLKVEHGQAENKKHDKVEELKQRLRKAVRKNVAGDINASGKAALPVPSYMEIGNHGERVDLIKYIAIGKITVFDFYSKYCGPCKAVGPRLKVLTDKRRDVVVRKIDINRSGIKGIDWKSPVAVQCEIRYVPYFIIYDAKGKLWLKDKKASQKVYSWLGE